MNVLKFMLIVHFLVCSVLVPSSDGVHRDLSVNQYIFSTWFSAFQKNDF